MHHPHHVARNTFVDIEGVRQPAPAPRFSRTPPVVRSRGSHTTASVLAGFGLSEVEIERATQPTRRDLD
jgi:alpha-methylacyl-CoA racemase